MSRHNGGEGFLPETYLMLFRTEELIRLNREYEVKTYLPGFFLFGSNGGGEGFGFNLPDWRMPVGKVPFVGMERSYIQQISPTFNGLFEAATQ
jgi:hypothetical protein